MTSKIDLALSIATAAHSGQVDKAGKPYIQHPVRVASNFQREELVEVALLHDVVEDTSITIEYLLDLFDIEVVQAVSLLTHKPEDSYDTYIKKISKNSLARAVKVADLRDNMNLKRLSQVTSKDLERVEKYKKSLEYLLAV